jgi:hypothetical protein
VPIQKPVVGLDIDGTLGDYHGHFLRFAAEWLGRTEESCGECGGPWPWFGLTEDTHGLPLYKVMGVTKAKYRECKLAYRQGGLKRSMPAYAHVREMSAQLHSEGVEVWITTTRPYLRLDNIDPDTREWLGRNRITYDFVIYGRDKWKQLIANVGKENIIIVADDLPEEYDKAKALGLWPLLRDQPYNHYREDIQGINRADNMLTLLATAQGHLQAWKEMQ